MQENPVAAAIREQLHAITAEGPFTIAKAMKVRRIAQASVQVLRALSEGVADKAPDPKLPLFEALSETAESFVGDQDDLGPIATSPAAETHATTIMREIIAAVPRFLAMQHSNPFELVRAVAHAEACGMAGLATKLRSQLGIEKPEEPTPPTPGSSAFSLSPRHAPRARPSTNQCMRAIRRRDRTRPRPCFRSKRGPRPLRSLPKRRPPGSTTRGCRTVSRWCRSHEVVRA